MSTPARFSHINERRNESDDQQPRFAPSAVLNVMPLNSVPYDGPPLEQHYSVLQQAEVKAEPEPLVPSTGPAMVFLPSCPDDEKWGNIVALVEGGVGLTGTATMGKVGPIIGLMDIGESEDSYVFSVSLPGVSRDENKFHFNIEPNGKIMIKGMTTTGEKIVCKNSQVFEMKTQNLSPPGHFTVIVQLPGPVNCQQLSASFGTDGVLRGIVKKR